MDVSPFDASFFKKMSVAIGAFESSRVHACIDTVRVMPTIVQELVQKERMFRRSVTEAKDILRDIKRPQDENLPHISSNDVGVLYEVLAKIRKSTNEANDLVNSVELSNLVLPQTVTAFFDKFSELLPDSSTMGTSVFTLEKLRRINEIRQDPKLGGDFSLIVKYRNLIHNLQEEVERIRVAIDEFNEWIHDMGHYLVQIDKMLPLKTASDSIVLETDLHMLDALFSGIQLIEMGLIMALRDDDDISTFYKEQKAHPYEPYKVFHKMRHIYTEKGIIWNSGDNEFWGKVEYADGVEFVAMNLYTNAVKYLEKFPGAKEIKTEFIQTEEGLEIQVSSYGPIPTVDELSRISYEKFRAKSVENYKGTGRGLCRVRKICEDAGYRFDIYVERDKAKGEFAPFVSKIFIPRKFQVFDHK